MNNKESREVQETQKLEDLPSENTIKLSGTDLLDLSGLTEGQISELKVQYAEGMIDLKKKAEELKMDVGALDAALGSFNDQTSRATQEGSSATINHSQTTSLGRTEVVIGNTDRAAAGKLSKTATGAPDKTVIIVGIIAVAAIIIAIIVGTK